MAMDLLNNPAFAMAMAAGQNLGNPYGQQVDPMEAYANSVMMNARLNQMRRQQEQQQDILRLRQEQAARQQAEHERTMATPITQIVPYGSRVDEYNEETGEWTRGELPQSLFRGTGMEAQARDALFGQDADPNSPEYAAAWDYLYGTKTQRDPTTGQAFQLAQEPPPGLTPPAGYQPPAPPPQPMAKDAESKAYQFLNTAADAHETMQAMEDTGFRLTEGEITALLNDPTKTMAVFRTVARPEAVTYAGALRNLIRAQLRRESGAAISRDEWLSGYQDNMIVSSTPEDLFNNRRRQRKSLVDSLFTASGNAVRTEDRPEWDERFKSWEEGFGTGLEALEDAETDTMNPANWD